ncbi:MAG: DUF167 domain-containing protein [Alphaproteobacteria bacterium]|nr:DUF167 domain-containing protein [Alphaproteobacteria bacterium]
MSDYYKIKDGKTYINIRVTPKASKNSIAGLRNNELLVTVTTVPENDKANIAVVKILSDWLNIAKSKISIISGHKCRNKVVCVDAEVTIPNVENKS